MHHHITNSLPLPKYKIISFHHFPQLLSLLSPSSLTMTPLLFLSLLFFFILPLPSSTQASSCNPFPIFKNHLFSTCIDLPYLSASLHFTYNPSNSTLSLAFAAPSSGWAAWGIGRSMVGTQSLIAFRRQDGTLTATTLNITQYGAVRPGAKIAFDVWGLEAEAEQYGRLLGVFATVRLPPGVMKVGHVWQVGPMRPGGVVGRHEFGSDNLQAVGVLDLSGQNSVALNTKSSGLSKGEVSSVLHS